MKGMIVVTLKSVFRDRIFHGIAVTSLLYLMIPSVSSLSMRQAAELSITLSLSLLSFILLLLAVFLGSAAIWKDVERRYSFAVLGLPMSRSSFVLGKFFGIALFLLVVGALLGALSLAVVGYASGVTPPQRPLVWEYLLLALGFSVLQYVLLLAVAFLFSSVSTSFFVPVFGTLAIYLGGSASQEVFDFLHTEAGQKLPALVKSAASALYYVLPNLSAFDFRVNAIYGVELSAAGVWMTLGYFVLYTGIVLSLAVLLFGRRELK